MVNVEKEIKKEEKKIGKFFSKSGNIWMIVSAVLLIALVAVLVWPSGMSKNAAGEKLVNFLNTEVVQGGGITLKDVVANGSLYEVTVIYQGKEIPVFTTKDGKYFIQSATPIPDSAGSITGQVVDTPKDVPKTDKPVLDLYVFSYCPYGLQAEKALIPVYNLLKNKADINVVFIGAMHGIHEENESLRQIAIQKIYGKDKLFAYLAKFSADTKIGDCNNNQACSYPLVKTIMASLGIDASKVNAFMVKDAPALYEADQQKAASLGISGSPDFVLNGVESSLGRSADAIKIAICAAFNTAPAECSQALSTTQASAWFGADAGTAGSSAASCG